MLQTLNIKNFAIIENTSLSFNLGFNVLIGETGAGKSIILDALNFVLGGKPNKDDIRNGTLEMTVKATFENVNSSVIEKLNEFQIDYDDLLIISRTFNQDGKSSCNINGEPVTVGMLKQIGLLLMDMYGQHDSLSLLNTKNHIKMLDSYKPDFIECEKNAIHNLLLDLKDVVDKMNSLGGDGEDRERAIDILNYQINEIEHANLKIGEDEELSNQISILSNFEKVSSSLGQAYNNINSSNASQALSSLRYAGNFDNSLLSLADRLEGCIIELEDVSMAIKEYLSNVNYSDKEIDSLSERLEHIKSLKKKYGNSIEEIFEYLEKSKQELDNMLNSEEILSKLSQQKSEILNLLYKESKSLHNKRIILAKEVESSVEQELKTLGMNNTKFSICFKELQSLEQCTFTNNGIDEVEFLFSANAGEKEKSLAKTISGGEMSRFMLAIKNVFASTDDVGLLVFDEIDSGVSGEIGYKVGQKLAMLSKKYQIICITHLPQVTALADCFINIKKFTENNHTKSVASYLDEEQLVEYLTSLFGSNKSQAGLIHAKELLDKAVAYKQELNKL